MPPLTKTDLHLVLSRCPRDIINLLKDNAGELFLAGGFIRATIAGEKVSDIDMFGKSEGDLNRIAKDLAYSRKGRFFSTKNAVTVLSPPRFPVQFIKRWLFLDPLNLVNSFDFTICQAVIWAEKIKFFELDGTEKGKYVFHSLTSPQFYPDLAARRLVYTHPLRNEDVGGSLLRVIKYVKRGYSVQAPTLAGVIARINSGINRDALDKVKERHPEDNHEIWESIVITGLLREVDPLTVVDGVDFVDEHEVVE